MIRAYRLRAHRSVGTRAFYIDVVDDGDDRARSLSPLADAAKKDAVEGGGYVDNRPTNAFERIWLEVDAPGSSLNYHGADAGSGVPRPKREVRDCQW